ncbi:MAG: NUDIX domain-containing protein, partial [Sandaracinaceae bacterium]
MGHRPISAGILGVRGRAGTLEFFLAHPGGPFYAKREHGVWSIPKGLLESSDSDRLAAAQRELVEETGYALPEGPYVAIGEVLTKSKKTIVAWAVRANFDPAAMVSNTFEIEWPPRSKRRAHFPEMDRAGWFGLEEAETKIHEAQRPFLERASQPDVLEALGLRGGDA